MAKRSSRRRPRRAPKMYPKGAPTSSSVRGRSPSSKQDDDTPQKSASNAPDTLTSEELREEYWYVYNDLKRIAVIAGTLFCILIALAFII